MVLNSFVSLRALKDDDAMLLSSLANNNKIAVNLRDRFPSPYTLNDAVSFLEMMKTEQKLINFAICYENNFVGMVGLILQDDIYRFSAEMGYWVGEPYWNKGIASSAVAHILEFARKSTPLVRVYSSVFENNVASQKVLINNGFNFDCIANMAVFKNKIFYNEYRYSIVFEEKT